MFRRANKRAGTLTEYAVVIMVAMSVFITMQTYVKRGVQGRIRNITDEFIGLTDKGDAVRHQYVSGQSKSRFVTNSSGTMRNQHVRNTHRFTIDEQTERSGISYSVSNEDWLDLLPDF